MSDPGTASGTTEVKEFLTSLIGNAPIGILAIDLEGRCTLANSKAANVFDKSPGELVDVEFERLVDSWPELRESLPSSSERGRKAFDLSDIRRRNRVFGVNGRTIVSGMLVTFNDVTEDVALREEQSRLVGQLEAHNRSLDQFAAMAAHDLQAPMRFIVANAHLLLMDLEELERPDLTGIGETIVEQGERMRELVLDLLEFCRAGQGELQLCTVDVSAVVAGEIGLLRAREEYARTSINVGELPDALTCDAVKFGQIVRNLLGNAVKFSQSNPQPAITVDAALDRARKEWDFRVEDNGPGVCASEHERVFQPFRRLDESLEGTGIGLAIVRKLLERLGGRVWIDPQFTGGSAFCFTIPNDLTGES